MNEQPAIGAYPRIRVSGDAAERSHQYGEQAAARIALIRDGYERAFAAKGIDWVGATRIARRYLPAIEQYAPHLLEELRGIAEGSGLTFDEILVINSRSEILSSATRAKGAELARFVGECTSFAIEADRAPTGEAVVGQNWDWLESLQDGVILLEVERTDGPNYVTLVEAGLLGKMVLTQNGVALGMNTLVTSRDAVTDGIPYHLQIRALADAQHVPHALEILGGMPRATSGNFVLSDTSGAVLDIESSPGGPRNLTPIGAAEGTLSHANHFVEPVADGHDLAPISMPDSYVRLGRLRRHLGVVGGVFSEAELQAALRDHVGYPNSVCCHPDMGSGPNERWKSLAAVLLSPKSRVLRYTAGPSCENEWNAIDYAELLG
ncbi:C45 family autoproteolytic acyltransferase/hydolase [Leucobacter tenebrionis]|uniref:C45 family autoproteolytic acyltransferase/hydolase n=1 Tax=Leucobacter tenebrionis TaxID=2873270 RepID=UPI001CA7B4C5|nr:C45 family peptidase [Leucobacter tenebrionis]QZY51076.1 C45 family peptidase [Leucobacter tenebrionis]